MSYARLGIIVGFAAEIALLVISRDSGGAGFVNFGPAIVGISALTLGFLLALHVLSSAFSIYLVGAGMSRGATSSRPRF